MSKLFLLTQLAVTFNFSLTYQDRRWRVESADKETALQSLPGADALKTVCEYLLMPGSVKRRKR